MIFCLGKGKHEREGNGYQKNYMAFNKKVSEDRYSEILIKVREILKDLKLELNEEDWSDEWKKVIRKQWIEISKIPEFDREVVEKIIGFELDLDNDLKISDETLASAIKIVEASGKTIN